MGNKIYKYRFAIGFIVWVIGILLITIDWKFVSMVYDNPYQWAISFISLGIIGVLYFMEPAKETKAPVENVTNKIIFLDIDGVINPVHYMNAMGKLWSASHNEIKSFDDYGQLFFYHNCDALKYIIDKTGAKIVISSTWRMSGLKVMQDMWRDRGLAGEVIAITPTEVEVVDAGKAEFYDSVCRGMEIDHWIKTNNFTGNYVIIDDTQDMLDEQEHLFIVTNPYCGLTFKNAEKAIAILNS